MMRRRHWFRLVAACVAALPLVGCGTSESPPGPGGGGANPVGAPGVSGGAGGASDFKIVILTNGSSPFWDACDRGLQDAGKELGVRVELVRNDATEGGQIRRLEQLATQGDVKGVGISVLEQDAAGVAEAMQ